eukprot:SAG31_NODE_308_length_17951_cov_4.779240_4_plen_343_part_00
MKKSEVGSTAAMLFDFGKQYAEIFSIFAMLLAYAPILPFLLPMGWVYFETLVHYDEKILRSQFKEHDTEQRLRTISSHTQLTGIFGQCIPVVFLAIQGTNGMLYACTSFTLLSVISYLIYLDYHKGGNFSAVVASYVPCVRKMRKSRAALVQDLDTPRAADAVRADAVPSGGENTLRKNHVSEDWDAKYGVLKVESKDNGIDSDSEFIVDDAAKSHFENPMARKADSDHIPGFSLEATNSDSLAYGDESDQKPSPIEYTFEHPLLHLLDSTVSTSTAAETSSSGSSSPQRNEYADRIGRLRQAYQTSSSPTSAGSRSPAMRRTASAAIAAPVDDDIDEGDET